MKNLFLAFIFSITIFSISIAQNIWEWQNPIPQGNDIEDIIALDQDSLFAVSIEGTILRTTDGGTQWDIYSNKDIIAPLYAIDFANHRIGCAVGGDNNGAIIVATSDCGENWTYKKFDTFNTLHSIQFVNPDLAFATGESGTFIKTINGGDSWSEKSLPYSKPFYDVFFVNPDTGWVVGYDYILKTIDQGETWIEQVNDPNELFYCAYFVNPDTGWIGRFFPSSSILKTTDGGDNWLAVSTPTSSVYDIEFFDKQNGLAIGFTYPNRQLIHTSDGGETWQTKQNLPTSPIKHLPELDNFAFLDTLTGWTTGIYGQIFSTTDGGLNWNDQSSGTRDNINSIFFSTKETGWAVGNDGLVLYTENGGNSWTEHWSSGIFSTDFQCTYFANPDTGWIVGQSGCVFRTFDGGATALSQNSGTSKTLNDIYFINGKIGWCVGNNGTIIKTSNSGKLWQSLESGVTEDLNAVHFVNDTVGWATGSADWPNTGIILKTIDGGETWFQQDSRTNNSIHDMYFIDENTGWAVCEGNTVLRTNDSGVNWESVEVGSMYRTFYSLYFHNKYKGWISGENGSLFYTADGGETWNEYNSGSANHLNSIYFTSIDTGWVVGNYGTIMRTTSAGMLMPNQAPHLISEDSVNCSVDSLFEYVAQAIDPEGLPVSYQFKDYPSWLSPSNDVITGIVPITAIDTSFLVIASDGELSDSLVVKISILGNSPPRIINLYDFSFSWSEYYLINLDTCVVDDDTPFENLIWEITPLDSNVQVLLENHTATFSATPYWVGKTEVIFHVSDGRNDIDSTIHVDVITPTEVTEDFKQLPRIFKLYNNYPNPFNPITTIKYDLPKESRISLSVYNIRGEFIYTIFNGLMGYGNHSFKWDASELPTGTYFLKLEADEHTSIIRCLLIK